MKLIEILLLLCLTYGSLTQIQETSGFLENGELNSFKLEDGVSTRMLDGLECLNNGHVVQNQCVCDGGYFDEHCGTYATYLSLNTNADARLSKGELFFYNVLSNEDQDLTLTFQYLPGGVEVNLALTSQSYYALPRNMTFGSYVSNGDTLWDLHLSFKKSQLSSTNRLFIFVNITQEQPPNKNFRVKLSDGSDRFIPCLILLESSNTLTIILIVIGAISIVLNVAGCIYFVKYKMRREIQAALRQRLERANLEAANNQNNSFERHHRHRTDLDIEEAALTQEDLNLYFPEIEFEKLESAFGQTDCPICLEEFKTGVTCRQLYCDHIFHTKCIQFWLAKQKACPTCKKNMSRKAIGEYYSIFKKKDKPEAIESDEQQPLEPADRPISNEIESDEQQQPIEPVDLPPTNAIESEEQQPLEHNDQSPASPIESSEPSEPIELPQVRVEPIENQIIIIKPNEEKAESNV